MPEHRHTDQPSAWIERFHRLIPEGEVLDLACGAGRHARLLAAAGHPVLALDRDPAALQTAADPGIATLAFDLEAADMQWPFAPGRFAGIVVANYLHRPLFPHLLTSLAAGGVLLYETFALGNERFGKPSNPAFLLKPGELLELTCGLRVVAFEDGYVGAPAPAMVQRLCARMPGFSDTPERVRLAG